MSLYLNRFEAMTKEAASAYELIGDCLLVEKPKEEEQKIGSFYLSDNKKSAYTLDKPNFVVVLAVGNGYYDDTTKAHIPVDVNPGDVVLIPSLSVRYFSQFPGIPDYQIDSIGITRASDIQLRFKGNVGYNEVKTVLSRFVKQNEETQS